ncbi:MAG: 16S rRNA (uracil(1498)-N(3))-methyltransferase [Candidatus Omnitrophica bacterium]|nr:16S rRNA (uracil(1498)-N(3))-methyltransferase [Candidatus Omnitrophota bacterium]
MRGRNDLPSTLFFWYNAPTMHAEKYLHLRRFFCAAAQVSSGTIELPEAEAAHARRVVRVRQGEYVAVLDGVGKEYQGTLAYAAERAYVEVRHMEVSAPDTCAVTLAAALPKHGKFEGIVDAATPLGVRAIIPLLTERTEIKIRPAQEQEKLKRWEAVAIAALKQCGRRFLPVIEPPRIFDQTFCRRLQSSGATVLMATLQDGAAPLKPVLQRQPAPAQAVLLIGPEGDFSPRETVFARDCGCALVRWDGAVLRCEAAVCALLSMVRYEWSF